MFSLTSELEMGVFLLSSQLWDPMQHRPVLVVLHAASLCEFVCAAVLLYLGLVSVAFSMLLDLTIFLRAFLQTFLSPEGRDLMVCSFTWVFRPPLRVFRVSFSSMNTSL